MKENSVLKIEPQASVERCEERVVYWTDMERRARETSEKPGMQALAKVSERARKQWGEALVLAMGRQRRSRLRLVKP